MIAQCIAQAAGPGATWGQRLVPLAVAGAVTALTIELIRRRRLREEYAMLWIFASAVLLVFAVFPHVLGWISQVTGVFYVTLVVVMTFGFLSLLILHLAVAASRSADETQKMAQRLALLEQRLDKLTGPKGEPEAPPGAEVPADPAPETKPEGPDGKGAIK